MFIYNYLKKNYINNGYDKYDNESPRDFMLFLILASQHCFHPRP